MTVELDTMMELRDLQVARDIAQRSEMGWFDVEFTMYGCCYLQGGQCYYRLSAEAEKIYAFIEAGAQNDLLPTDIMELTKRTAVPVGMKEWIARTVKINLAQEMQQAFPKAFLLFLAQTADMATEESAWPILTAQWADIEGCFDEERLSHFQQLADYAYSCRKITGAQHQKLSQWVAEERASMQDNPLEKDIFEKTFYAIAYETPGGLQFLENACSAQIYRQKYQLESRGILVTPVLAKTYWYNYTVRLPQVRQQFEQTLHQHFTQDYMALLQSISRQNKQLSPQLFEQRLNEAAERFGAKAAATLRHYGFRWGIL